MALAALSGAGVGTGTGMHERVLRAGSAGGPCSEVAVERAFSADFAVASDTGKPGSFAGVRLYHSGLRLTTATGPGGDPEPTGVRVGDLVSKNSMERSAGSRTANVRARALAGKVEMAQIDSWDRLSDDPLRDRQISIARR